jgi:vesicle coat complex subunit
MAYFEGARRGEMRELQEALNSRSLDDKKNALKKVIAQMTVGKDLSDLFQPVIKCLEFNDLEMKKLVCI